MELPVIGLTGRAGAGKDTVYRLLHEYNPGFHRVAYADALKHEVYEALRLSHGEKYLADPLKSWAAFEDYMSEHKECDPNTQEGAIRQLLQAWGMIRRDMEGNDYWANKVSYAPGTVITDVRFPNEGEQVRDHGGFIVGVWRDGLQPMEHISERGEVIPDYTLRNNGTIDELRMEAIWFVQHCQALRLSAY